MKLDIRDRLGRTPSVEKELQDRMEEEPSYIYHMCKLEEAVKFHNQGGKILDILGTTYKGVASVDELIDYYDRKGDLYKLNTHYAEKLLSTDGDEAWNRITDFNEFVTKRDSDGFIIGIDE